MRSDSVQALEPYLQTAPRLAIPPWRLELLRVGAAEDAIRRPALAAGVQFDPEAARRLADELSNAPVRTPEGQLRQEPGDFVEPIQLQVVCHRLWEALPPGTGRVDVDHVRALGDIDEALSSYYADQVLQIAREDGVPERRIRDWLEEEFITAEGARGRADRDSAQERNIPDSTVNELIRACLIRDESHEGIRSLELAHPRLIGPIRESNSEWRQRLAPWREQARLWNRSGRPEAGLLRGPAELAAAKRAEGAGPVLDDYEEEFLKRSVRTQVEERRRLTTANRLKREAEARERAEQGARIASENARIALQRASRGSKLALLAAIAFILALIYGLIVSWQYAVRSLAGAAAGLLDRQYDLAALLSQTAFQLSPGAEARRNLLTAVGYNPDIIAFLRATPTAVYSVSISPDGTLVAAGFDDGSVALWSARPDGHSQPALTLKGTGSDEVDAVAFSPDGAALAAGSRDGKIRVWDIRAVQESRSHQDQPLPKPEILKPLDDAPHVRVWSIAFRPRPPRSQGGGSSMMTLAAAYSSGSIKIWHFNLLRKQEWKATTIVPGETENPGEAENKDDTLAVCFSPDGTRLAFGGKSSSVIVTDIPSQPSPQPSAIPTGDRDVYSLSFSPDGKRLAIGFVTGDLEVWDARPKKPDPYRDRRWFARQHSGIIWSLAFSADGHLLASGGMDHQLLLWDAARGRVLDRLRGHSNQVNSVAFSPVPHSWILASASDDKTVLLWDVSRREPLLKHDLQVSAVAFSSDGKTMVSGSGDRKVYAWAFTAADIAAPRLICDGRDSGDKEVVGAGLPGKGRTVVAFKNGVIAVFEGRGRQPAARSTVHREGLLRSLAVGPPDDRGDALVASGSQAPHGRLVLSRLSGTRLLGARGLLYWPRDGSGEGSGPTGPRVRGQRGSSPVAAQTASGAEAEAAPLAGLPTSRTDAMRMTVLAVAFSPDGRKLAAAIRLSTRKNTRSQVLLWDVNLPPATAPHGAHEVRWDRATLDAPRELSELPDDYMSVAFSPDGLVLAAGAQDDKVRLWDLRKNSPKAVELGTEGGGHHAWVMSVAFSGDGRILATGGRDGRLILWDLATSPPLAHPFDAQAAEVDVVVFPPGSGTPVCATDDGRIMVWNHPQLTTWRTDACRIANRNLSCEEWRQYLPRWLPYRLTCPELPRPRCEDEQENATP
jgi:WD40 repeat protein